MLLPHEERNLRHQEYRLRLAIISLFFISCAIVLGIIGLMPAYIYSRQQEKEALVREGMLQQSRRESGAEQIERELLRAQAIAQKINSSIDPVVYSDIIQKIVSHRKKGLLLTSFSMNQNQSTSTAAEILIQGKAATRDILLGFKKELEEDNTFTDIELPLSGLAKNKDVQFELRLKAKRQ